MKPSLTDGGKYCSSDTDHTVLHLWVVDCKKGYVQK